jgi:hypothetical protein
MTQPAAGKEQEQPEAARVPVHPENLSKPDGARGYRGGDLGSWHETPQSRDKRRHAKTT